MVNFASLGKENILKETYDIILNGTEDYAKTKYYRKDELPGYNVTTLNEFMNYMTINEYMSTIAEIYDFKMFNNSLPLANIYLFPVVSIDSKFHESYIIGKLQRDDFHCPICGEKHELKDFYSFPVYKQNIVVFDKDTIRKDGDELIEFFASLHLYDISPVCNECLPFLHPEILDIIKKEDLSYENSIEKFKKIHDKDAVDNLLLYKLLVNYKIDMINQINYFVNYGEFREKIDWEEMERIGKIHKMYNFEKRLDDLFKS